MKIAKSDFNFSRFHCGDIVEATDGSQYRISDVSSEVVTLEKLTKEEHCKPAFLAGRIND